MIIVRLAGGLGNQMFQYAAARRLAQRHNAQLKLDLGGLEHPPAGCTLRSFQLGHLNISAGIASPEEVASLYRPAANLAELTCDKLCRLVGIPRPAVMSERHFHFDPRLLSAPDRCYLVGYWQSERYFSDAEEVIRGEFTLKEPPWGENRRLAEVIRGCNAVSLHVRRGDYVTDSASNQTHGVCGLDYYRSALEELCRAVPDPQLFVFSDEPQWVLDNLDTGLPTTIVDHNGPELAHEDLRLMSLCRHNVIANSSFSWWGAWLNANRDKIVFAPKQWLRDTSHDTSDVVPVAWRKC